MLHAIATSVRADHDMFMVPYAKGSPLDPASYDPAGGSNLVTKMGIDATRKSNYPDEIAYPATRRSTWQTSFRVIKAAQRSRSLMKIDIHAHFVDRHYLDELVRVLDLETEQTADGKTLLRRSAATIAWSRPDMYHVEHRLRDMERKGIDMRVLSVSAPNVYPWPAPSRSRWRRHVNDALARYCRAHPDKFVGLASLPLADVEASSRRSIVPHELGLKGLAIGSNIGGPPLNDARFEPLWAKIDRLQSAGGRAPDVPEGHLRHGRVRAAAACRA